MSKKRGAYLRWEKDPSLPIPESTLRSRQKRKLEDLSSDESSEPEGNAPKRMASDESHLRSENDQSDMIVDEDNAHVMSDEECSYSDVEVIVNNESNHENESDEEENSEEDPTTLYENGRITRKQSEMLILAYLVRHAIPDVGLTNMLNVVDAHLPQEEYRSKYMFLKAFPEPNMQFNYFCDPCKQLLKFGNQLETICESCGTTYNRNTLKSKGMYFIRIPLKDQLAEIVESKLYLQFRKDCEESDVVNGSVYRKLKDQQSDENFLSIQWNVDGVNFFNNSKNSVWPILVTINELKYRLRKNNVILCGLWYGKKKPCMNLYLKPFVEELLELRNNGFQCKPYSSSLVQTLKVFSLFSPVDSIARPMVQNMKQFNGKYGCSICYHKGKSITVSKAGKKGKRAGKARVYCFRKKKLRNSTLHMLHLRKAIRLKKPVKGVKGPSVVSLLPEMNIIYSYPPDYMHSICLGIINTFVKAWFDPKYKGEKFYLGSRISEVNERLLAIEPPVEITRVPKEINEKLNANELKNFAAYYSIPCLEGIMESKYLKHWHLFVFSFHIFLKEKVDEESRKLAQKAMNKFCEQVKSLYGEKFQTFNLHLSTHLALFTKFYGALWAWSAFPYEGFNGVMKIVFHGSQYVPEQLCKFFTRLRYIKKNSRIFDQANVHPYILKAFTEIMKQCSVQNCIEYSPHLKLFGKPVSVHLSFVQKVLMENHLEQSVEKNCKHFHRFNYNRIRYHSCHYAKMKKRDNSIILTEENKILRITALVGVQLSESLETVYIVFGEEAEVLEEVMCCNGIFSSKKYSFVVRFAGTVGFCQLSKIKSKCVKVPKDNNKFCIIPVINKFETD